jgi:hypothetical protein
MDATSKGIGVRAILIERGLVFALGVLLGD